MILSSPVILRMIMDSKDGLSSSQVGVVLTLLTIIVSVIVFVIRMRIQYSASFQNCVRALYSRNPIEQITAAILLRSYMEGKRLSKLYLPSYVKDALNLSVVLLRLPKIPIELQKTLSDGFSYVNNMDGHDMQYINMMNALIKPRSAVQHEAYGRSKDLGNRISMKHADFYHAVLQMANFNFVDFSGAIFSGCIINDARFHNCICRNANFKCANVEGVVFDSNCVLDKANFYGATGLSSAIVRRGEKRRILIDFLDKDGIFHEGDKTSGYVEPTKKIKIFISKLGIMDSTQQSQYNIVKNLLEKRSDLELITIDRNEYRSTSQLVDVADKINQCHGCVIFAFEYLNVEHGHIHKNVTNSSDCQTFDQRIFVSPWLHIETALANNSDIPCLIIYDANLYRDGMFDDAIISANELMSAIAYSDNISCDYNTIEHWLTNVKEYYIKRHNERK